MKSKHDHFLKKHKSNSSRLKISIEIGHDTKHTYNPWIDEVFVRWRVMDCKTRVLNQLKTLNSLKIKTISHLPLNAFASIEDCMEYLLQLKAIKTNAVLVIKGDPGHPFNTSKHRNQIESHLHTMGFEIFRTFDPKKSTIKSDFFKAHKDDTKWVPQWRPCIITYQKHLKALPEHWEKTISVCPPMSEALYKTMRALIENKNQTQDTKKDSEKENLFSTQPETNIPRHEYTNQSYDPKHGDINLIRFFAHLTDRVHLFIPQKNSQSQIDWLKKTLEHCGL